MSLYHLETLILPTAILPTTLHFKNMTPKAVERLMFLQSANGMQNWKCSASKSFKFEKDTE